MNVHNLHYRSGEMEEALSSESADMIRPQAESRNFDSFLSFSIFFLENEGIGRKDSMVHL